MSAKPKLKILFACILVSMIVCTGFASTRQSLFQWGGLTTGQDRYWTIATLFDAYFGFLTFYVWVFYKEQRWLPRIAWFIAILALGNMAMASYVLVQLAGLRKEEPASNILAARND
jgi:isoprenylcysteine carboxyl methyltransferase (ICMT) family protein YpbQ